MGAFVSHIYFMPESFAIYDFFSVEVYFKFIDKNKKSKKSVFEKRQTKLCPGGISAVKSRPIGLVLKRSYRFYLVFNVPWTAPPRSGTVAGLCMSRGYPVSQ